MSSKIIEIQAIRSTIKRTFPNDTNTIIGELLQNAQRSGATEINFTVTENTVVIQDNGSGIKDFVDLLVMGKSNYSTDVIANQHPMGIGFHALLAHAGVEYVEVCSHGQRLKVNCDRWWNDYEYAVNWQNLLESNNEYNNGTTITLKLALPMAQSFSESLKPEPQKYSLTPANGYALVGLKISLNAEEINADYPSWIENELLFSINYLNNPLKVFTSKNGYNGKFQLINWYGQVIEVKTNIPFGFLYEITTGRPIELQAPIRTGVICDQKWTQFQSFVVSHIADYFQHTIYTPKAIEVKAYNYLRQKYPSIPDCPYFVAEQILGYDEKYNESVVICEKIVLRYDGDEKLIYNYVKVERKDAEDEDDVEWLEYEGYESFVPLINEPVYVPVDYHQNSLKNKINKIYWRPGAKIVTNCSESVISFRHLEQFALATCLEEVKWQPITKDVYAIAYRSGGNLPDVEEWIIGCGSEPAVALTQYYFAGYRHD